MIRNWLRRREQPQVGADVWRRVEAGLPFLGYLAESDRFRLRDMALRFLSEKEWHGAHGMEVTNEIRLAVALQACLPVLNLGLQYYAGWVGIVVYPGDFVVPRRFVDEAGVMHEFEDPAAGEAWEGGPVLIAWFDRAEEADGMNVVIHEFVHKIDMLNGEPDGLPPLHEEMSRAAWSHAFAEAYADFCARVDSGEETEIDPYAAEHPSEFFAVLSEVFFEDPTLLLDEYPAVYDQLRLFFHQDPAAAV